MFTVKTIKEVEILQRHNLFHEHTTGEKKISKGQVQDQNTELKFTLKALKTMLKTKMK